MEYLDKIRSIAGTLGTVRIMEVCGGHTNTIVRYGIRELLPPNIKLISGPGCPVCVTSQKDIDSVVEIALNGVKIGAYGDMINVPGTRMSLRDAQAKGADVKAIYCIDQIMNEKDRVFFAAGFETTIPMTARLLEKGNLVFSSHKLIPPAMVLLKSEMKIDGFIDPGHVSTIIGSNIWENLGINAPQVISGFNPDALVKSISILLTLIKKKEIRVVNEYPEVVFPEGNRMARALIEKTMKIADSEWRGMGILPGSGMIPRDESLDARIRFADILKNIKSTENRECRCGEIIRGLIEPSECQHFGKGCSPGSPLGACMVSESEGACAIAFKYGKSLGE